MTKRFVANPLLLSLNHLDCPSVCRVVTEEQLHPDSPAAIKKSLALDELDRELFPVLVTGVRWWPFLTLAMDCSTEADFQHVFVLTRRLKSSLGRKKARVGPEKHSSFRPYQSMAKKIREREGGRVTRSFLEKSCFDGRKNFFTNYDREEKWKALLLDLNGKPARAYVRAYKAAEKAWGGYPDVWQVISIILANPPRKFDLLLWRGAFGFALLRCLYGWFDRGEEKAKSHGFVMEWKQDLVRIIESSSSEMSGSSNSTYLRLLDKIEDENSPPPLASQTKKLRKEGRPILESLRIPLFHKLYFSPNPNAAEG